MATPHVTGAAAILKQRHPDWSGPRLKSALMGASAGLDGLGAFQIGAGRLDVGRAVAQDVVADSASVSFPVSAFPHDVFGGFREGGEEPSQTSFSDDVDLTGDRTVTWGAADARLSGVDLDHDDAVAWSGSDVMIAADAEVSRGHNVTLTHPAGTKSYSRGGEFPGPNSWYQRDERLLSPEGAAEAYSYDLTFSSRGRVPEGEIRRVADSELAEVGTTYAPQGPVSGGAQRSDTFLGVERGFSWFEYRDQEVPGKRTEYFTPGPWLSICFQGVNGRGESSDRRAELAAGASERSWNSAPLNVGLDPYFPSFLRGDDRFRFQAGMFDTAERDVYGGSGGGDGWAASTVVKADGTEIFRGPAGRGRSEYERGPVERLGSHRRLRVGEAAAVRRVGGLSADRGRRHGHEVADLRGLL